MTFPDRRWLSTGQGARILGTTEPRLSETVRRGKVHPPPEVVAGRRLWSLEQLYQAAEALGITAIDVRTRLESLSGGAADAQP